MYGRLYIPTGRLDALYSTRLGATLQALIAAISAPPLNAHPDYHGNRTGSISNIVFSLQHDVGKWCTEYTYSAEDGMCGIKLLHNFGKLGEPVGTLEESDVAPRQHVGVKRVDEEEPIEGGLKGRVSIGTELYVSAKERSAGGQSVVETKEYQRSYSHSSISRNPFYDFTRCHSSIVSRALAELNVSKTNTSSTSNDDNSTV
jgi:mitochondrial distribution and morphology protein 10